MEHYTYPKEYDVIVVGAGHAGCEACLASARMGAKTLLLTMNLDTVAKMSCNPAIGGIAKGHLVREIDALGGEMGKITDKTGIQFRMLNTKKGPAVRSLRAQADKREYSLNMRQILEQQENLDIREQMVEEILTETRRAVGVTTRTGIIFRAKAVIISPGTFLNGLIHIGEISYPAGRLGDEPSAGLSISLGKLGLSIGRLKTGTSPRVNAETVNFSNLRVQEGDTYPQPFSFSTQNLGQTQMPCHITYTNEKTHGLIRKNLNRSPLYAGRIVGIGPRYCPSIEDKVVRFVHHGRHQIFLEPEGKNTRELYLNGISTSMPADVQIDILHTIEGLEKAEIMRFGYAIEYDFVFPTQLKPTLETKSIDGLYLAGQINGTSGYEEAASQGIVAGINACLKINGEKEFALERSQAYIGVLIDDLVTKGTNEPYRMFTSRAEHRLILRHDNADIRLMEHGYKFGLISEEQIKRCRQKAQTIQQVIAWLSSSRALCERIKRPDAKLDDLPCNGFDLKNLSNDIKASIELELKYEGYIKRENSRIRQLKRLEETKVPEWLRYEELAGLRREAAEKFCKVKPLSIGQASRIPGITPCDISILLVWLQRSHKSIGQRA